MTSTLKLAARNLLRYRRRTLLTALLIMLGSLGTAWGMVMAFWFGTTNGSATKTELLAKAPAVRS